MLVKWTSTVVDGGRGRTRVVMVVDGHGQMGEQEVMVVDQG